MRLFPFLHSSHPLGRVMTSLQSWAGRNLASGLKIGLSRGGQNVEIPCYIRALEMEFPDEKLEDCQISHYKSIVVKEKEA